MNDEPIKTTDYVAAWIARHRTEIGATQVEFAWNEQYARTFCAVFDTPKHLIEIRAWDHAHCLDIFATCKESSSKDYAYSVSGDCGGVIGLSARLSNFINWLTENNTPHCT